MTPPDVEFRSSAPSSAHSSVHSPVQLGGTSRDDIAGQNPDALPWTDAALCKGMTDVFFGSVSERPQSRAKREALADSFCRRCPVSAQCRASGRANNEHGYWGGESEEERATAGFPPRSPSRRSVIAARDNSLAA